MLQPRSLVRKNELYWCVQQAHNSGILKEVNEIMIKRKCTSGEKEHVPHCQVFLCASRWPPLSVLSRWRRQQPSITWMQKSLRMNYNSLLPTPTSYLLAMISAIHYSTSIASGHIGVQHSCNEITSSLCFFRPSNYTNTTHNSSPMP